VERHPYARAQIGRTGQVRDLSVGRGAGGSAVIERDGTGFVVRHGLFEGLRARGGDVAGGDQWAAQAQTDRAEGAIAPSAEGVGVGDDALVGRVDEHALDLLPTRLAAGQGEVGQRLHGGRFVQCSEPTGADVDLGQAVVLGHITADLYMVTEGNL